MCTFDIHRLQGPMSLQLSARSCQMCILVPCRCFALSQSCALLRGISNRLDSNYLSDSKPEYSLQLRDQCCATKYRSRFYYSLDCFRLQLRCQSLSYSNIRNSEHPGKSSDLRDKFHLQTHKSTIHQFCHLI